MDLRRIGTIHADGLERLAKYPRAWQLLTGTRPA